MKHYFVQVLSTILLLISTTLVSAQPVQPESAPVKLKMDTKSSKIAWKGKKPIREHTGFIKLSKGELEVNDKTIVGGTFTVDMNTISNTDIEDEESRNKLVNHLKSPDFFDVKKYPTATFVITRVTNQKGITGEKKTTHRVEGDLTIKGITKKIAFDASINILNGRFTATSPEFALNRKEWNVNYTGVGDNLVADEILFSVDLVSQ